jgi:hypothetical protein
VQTLAIFCLFYFTINSKEWLYDKRGIFFLFLKKRVVVGFPVGCSL